MRNCTVPEFEEREPAAAASRKRETIKVFQEAIPLNDLSNPDTESKTPNHVPFEKLKNVCFPFQNQGYCARGDGCKFDHFPAEVCPCIEWSMNNCSRGISCRFAHVEPRPPLPANLRRRIEMKKTREKFNRPIHNQQFQHFPVPQLNMNPPQLNMNPLRPQQFYSQQPPQPVCPPAYPQYIPQIPQQPVYHQPPQFQQMFPEPMFLTENMFQLQAPMQYSSYPQPLPPNLPENPADTQNI